MNIVEFKKTEDDSGEFLDRIRSIVTGSLISSKAQDFFLIKIDNWFGDRWLVFSGKIKHRWAKNLTIPPFVQDRVLSEKYFTINDDNSEYKLSENKSKIHRYSHSGNNLSGKIGGLYPNSAFFWYSGNTKSNGRGCLMAYLPAHECHWPWYIGFISEPWRINNFAEISEQDLKNFEIALKLKIKQA